MKDADPVLTQKNKSGFTHVIASEKHEREAQRSLQDIVAFYQHIDKSMRKMLQEQSKGKVIDQDLFDRMVMVQDHYKKVMKGFLELDSNSQRHALISFADAIQDLLKYIHMRKVS